MKSYNKIINSSIFRLNGENINLCETLIELVNEIDNSTDENAEYLNEGEFNECCLGDLIIGAYWALNEWHGGQNSIEYAALCSLGTIYQPNRASGPDRDGGDWTAYEMICNYFEENSK